MLSPFPPKVALHLNYLHKKVNVNLGNDIPVPDTAKAPHFDITPLNALGADLLPTPTKPVGKTLTLVLTDPDATSRVDPVKGQMCHWILGGIRFQLLNETQRQKAADPNVYALDLSGANFESMHQFGRVQPLTELIEYLQPAPPPRTGRHRYVFVLLEAEERRGNKSLEKPSDRPHWGYEHVGQGVMDWAKDNGLVPIGKQLLHPLSLLPNAR